MLINTKNLALDLYNAFHMPVRRLNGMERPTYVGLYALIVPNAYYEPAFTWEIERWLKRRFNAS